MAARGPPGGESGRAILEPEAAAFDEGFEDGVSGPDSGPEVRGEAGRGAAYTGDTYQNSNHKLQRCKIIELRFLKMRQNCVA